MQPGEPQRMVSELQSSEPPCWILDPKQEGSQETTGGSVLSKEV